ncbi:uncharacterized protein LOC124286061 isoform X2 [Haliotis rubra]|uniref:uncharacterized protein LOC124286061 isoform X2 n=1 Tax=Haliotis rubra TaxID=36100 RepID=UPI001EE53A24|nr:uncharacterized protein LOC124286061 isoform X2 [Haliotis rubra]
MTAWHLFTTNQYQFHGNLSAQETIVTQLKDKNTYVQLDKQQFHFKDFVFESEELDVIILELDVPEGHRLPPSLPLMSPSHPFGCISAYSHKVTIIGYDGDGTKLVDISCLTIQVSKEECCLARQDLQKMGFHDDWYNGKPHNGKWYNDLAHPHLLPLKTHFAHGASGSPVVVPYEGKPLVIAMFIKGYPEFYWDLEDKYKRCIDEKFIIKAAVKLSMFDMDFIADDIMDRS